MNRLPALLPFLLLAACTGTVPREQLPDATLAQAPGEEREVHLSLIRRMQDEGAYYASLAHIEAHRLRHGASPALRLLEADALRQTGQHEAAAGLYRGLVNSPHAAAAWHGLGLVAVARGDRAGAEQALSRATAAAPLNADYQADLGYLLLDQGELGRARAPLAKAAELAPANPRALANLALWATLSGDRAAAEAIMDRASLDPAARQEVRRLALELEPKLRAAARRAASPSAPAANPSAQNTVAPPQGMLQRFRPDAPGGHSTP